MQSFDPVSLRLFIAVCEERNIARAAEREGIAPSAVSKRISAIEADTGVLLLRRGRRGVATTPAGDALLRHARELLLSMDRARAEIGAFAGGVQGHVRVFASLSAIAEFLPEDIAAFVRRYDKVRVSLDERVSSEVIRGVEEGRADIGVCWDAIDPRRLHAVPYERDHLAVAVPPGHPLARRRSVAFEETLAFEHVEILAGSIVRATQHRHAAALGKTVRSRIQVTTLDAACRIVAAGLAVAIVPLEVVAPFEQALGVKGLPLSDRWAKRRFIACVRDRAALSPPARMLLESFVASAKAREAARAQR
ncbi:MAG: LysR family transcriptional regulator [Rhodospirillales bacterium]|nr:LysR family transcriptional regulator [Rhodospirillales bacterium]